MFSDPKHRKIWILPLEKYVVGLKITINAYEFYEMYNYMHIYISMILYQRIS